MLNEISIDLLAGVIGGADGNEQTSQQPGGAGGDRGGPVGNDRGYQAGESPRTHALDRNGQSVPRGYPGRSF